MDDRSPFMLLRASERHHHGNIYWSGRLVKYPYSGDKQQQKYEDHSHCSKNHSRSRALPDPIFAYLDDLLIEGHGAFPDGLNFQ